MLSLCVFYMVACVLLSSQASERLWMCESVCRYVCRVKSACSFHRVPCPQTVQNRFVPVNLPQKSNLVHRGFDAENLGEREQNLSTTVYLAAVYFYSCFCSFKNVLQFPDL